MEFKVLDVQETTDGRIYVEWETVADDGLPLVEADYYTPQTTDLEGETKAWLAAKKDKRAQLNSQQKKKKKQIRFKRTTAELSPEARDRIKGPVE